MKFFNSVTGRVEDDGQEAPLYSSLDEAQKANFNQIDLGMLQDPSKYPFGELGMLDSLMPNNPSTSQASTIEQSLPPKNEELTRLENLLSQKKSYSLPLFNEGQEAKSSVVKSKEDLLSEYRTLQEQARSKNDMLDMLQGGKTIAQAFAYGSGAQIGDGAANTKMLKESANKPVQDYETAVSTQMAEMSNQEKRELVDPNSDLSKTTRKLVKDLASKLKMDLPEVDNMSANGLKTILANLSEVNAQKERAQQDAANRAMQAEQSRMMYEMKKEDKMSEKLDRLTTPYGTAFSEKEAEKLRGAATLEETLMGNIDRLVELRKKNNGAALPFSEDRKAANSIAGVLLTDYNKIAELGALAGADKAILNTSVPDNPLDYTLSIPGQKDPVITQLETLRGSIKQATDAIKKNKTREGFAARKEEPSKKTILKKQYSKSANKTKVIYSDGSEEILDGKQ